MVDELVTLQQFIFRSNYEIYEFLDNQIANKIYTELFVCIEILSLWRVCNLEILISKHQFIFHN